jgi:hypothetical protein
VQRVAEVLYPCGQNGFLVIFLNVNIRGKINGDAGRRTQSSEVHPVPADNP